MITIQELKECFSKIEKLTVLEVPDGSVLVVHVPHDSDYHRCGHVFEHLGFGRVIIDPIGCTFSAIKKEK